MRKFGNSINIHELIAILYVRNRTSLVAQMRKNLPAMQEAQDWSLGQEDPLEKKMAIHHRVCAWRIPWTEDPGVLQSMGSQRVRHTFAYIGKHTYAHTFHTYVWKHTYTYTCQKHWRVRILSCTLKYHKFMLLCFIIMKHLETNLVEMGRPLQRSV